MQPDARWAHTYPRPSFEKPLPIPNFDPGAAPNISITINCSWLPAIRGALQQLIIPPTWAWSTEAELELVTDRAQTLISLFQECATAQTPFLCFADFSSSSAPFGTMTAGYVGQWLPILGWASTTAQAPSTPTYYTGILLYITLDEVITIENIEVNYDYTPGEIDDPADYGLDVQNRTGTPALIGTPLLFSQMSGGTNQHYNTGPYPTPTASILVALFAARHNDRPPSGGQCYITAIVIEGSAPKSPCE